MKLVNVENFEQFKELVSGSAFTWLGMALDIGNLKAIEKAFKEVKVMGPDQEMEAHVWTGVQGNEWMGLIRNPYPNDLICLSFPLNRFNNIGTLSMLRVQWDAHWLDDVYDNNLHRERVNNFPPLSYEIFDGWY